MRHLRLIPVLPAILVALFVWAQPSRAEIPPRQQAPNDESVYRRFVLENGMKVLLLSDPKLNKSSAALTAGVGSMSDPRSRQGLAHFFEHMVFLGTEKYPVVGEFDAYLKTNGGYNNAGTWPDHTTYMLEIPHEAFEGAIDRLSQFFIAPLFDAEFTEREMNAVNSEFQRHLENDGFRAGQVVSSVYREGHPMNHFSIGNRATLEGTTREELLKFYTETYSANQMTLALTGKASLDELEAWARKYFAAVPNRNLEPIRFTPDYLPEKPALRLLRVEPVKDVRQLNIEFPLPPLADRWESKPGDLISSILGYEGAGSLLSQLKAEGLATSLSASAYDYARSFASFEVQVELTESGLAKFQRVLELLFAAVADMQRSDYPAYFFRERQVMAGLDEAFRDKGEGADLAMSLSAALWTYPLEVAERVPYLWIKEDADAYREVLSHLRPQNMLVTLVARGLPTDRTEPYIGAKYSYVEDAGAAYTSLLNPPSVATIHLPKPNPFIPAAVRQLPRQPVRLIDEPALSLYYSQDTEFERPMVAEIFRVRLPRKVATVENATLLSFYEACVNEALNETTYTAREAGLQVSVSADLERGVQIVLDGYSEAAPRLLDTVVANLTRFELSEERFAAIKDRLVRPMEDFQLEEAFQIAGQTRHAVMREYAFRLDEMLPVAKKVTLGGVKAFAAKLFAQGKIEGIVHGNVSTAEAIAAARKVESALKTKPVPVAELTRRKLLVQPAGESLATVEKVAGSNSAYRVEYDLGGDTPEIRAATLLLSNVIDDVVYTELRTRQQLGYVVSGGASEEIRSHFMIVLLQSGEYSAEELAKRAEPVVDGLPALVRSLSDEDWAALVAGTQAQLEEKDKTIADRTSRLFALAYLYGAEWGRREATLEALSKLTRERAAEILATAVAPTSARARSFFVISRSGEVPAAPKPSFADRATWKKSRKYE